MVLTTQGEALMNTRNRSISRLLAISSLMLVSAAVLLGQAQPQTKAQTQPQTKAETQAQTKAGTEEQTKAGTQAQTKAGTQASIRAGTKADTLKPPPQKQTAIPTKSKKVQKQTAKARSLSGRCQAITENGTRCTNKALPGSKYCRQHGGN
jgi:hypothetical protein